MERKERKTKNRLQEKAGTGGMPLLIALLWYFLYPETLGNIEAESFFVWTPDYLESRLSEGAAGVWAVVSDFLSQFFRWRESGAMIQALLLACLIGILEILFRRLRCHEASWIRWAIAGLFLCLQLHWARLEPAITTVVLVGIIAISIAFLPVPERIRKRILPLHRLGIANPKVRTGVSAVFIALSLLAFIFMPTAHRREHRIAIRQAATATAWNKVLHRTTAQDMAADPVLQRYALLALANQGTLAEKLPELRLTSADCFRFHLPSLPEERYFNALFYRSLGLYNEYVHQLFEVGIQHPNGMTFGCLRQITDGYLKMGNGRLADKYLTLLSRSTCHADWVSSRRKLLNALKEKPVETPEKSHYDIFIGSYPFLQEMELLLKENPGNAKAKMYLDAASRISSKE